MVSISPVNKCAGLMTGLFTRVVLAPLEVAKVIHSVPTEEAEREMRNLIKQGCLYVARMKLC